MVTFVHMSLVQFFSSLGHNIEAYITTTNYIATYVVKVHN